MSAHQTPVQHPSQASQPEEYEIIEPTISAENGSLLVNTLLMLPKAFQQTLIPIFMNPAIRKSIFLFYMSLDPASVMRRRIETTLLDSILG